MSSPYPLPSTQPAAKHPPPQATKPVIKPAPAATLWDPLHLDPAYLETHTVTWLKAQLKARGESLVGNKAMVSQPLA